MSTMKRGLFIALEGCDRCGKTTQAKLLTDYLTKNGRKVQKMQFPDRTTQVGCLINSYLRKELPLEDHAIHLLFAANRWELKEKMFKLLKEGTTLIVDRYSPSGIAFTAAKEGMDLNWCIQQETGLLSPDMIIFLEVKPEVAQQRGQYGDEIYEDPDIQRRVKAVYQKLMTDKLLTDNWKVVDANQSEIKVHQDLVKIVESFSDK